MEEPQSNAQPVVQWWWQFWRKKETRSQWIDREIYQMGVMEMVEGGTQPLSDSETTYNMWCDLSLVIAAKKFTFADSLQVFHLSFVKALCSAFRSNLSDVIVDRQSRWLVMVEGRVSTIMDGGTLSSLLASGGENGFSLLILSKAYWSGQSWRAMKRYWQWPQKARAEDRKWELIGQLRRVGGWWIGAINFTGYWCVHRIRSVWLTDWETAFINITIV